MAGATGLTREPGAATDGRATLADVARVAGVSTATVSRALAGNYPVAARTRERIDAAVSALGYVANVHARALAGTRTRVIGLIVSDLSSEFFTRIFAGVENAATARDCLCYVMVSDGRRRRELDYVDRLIAQQVDVVVLAGGVEMDAVYARELRVRATALERQGGRLVLVARPNPAPDIPALTVMYDNVTGAFALTEHLLSRGHRDILYVGGPRTHTTTAQRLDGYRQAHRARDLEVPEHLVSERIFGRDAGRRAVRESIAQGHAFTAVFGGNDYVAAGAIEELAGHGLRVPEDISVVGYDNISLATDITPKLTTCHVPLVEMGTAAVELAMDESSGFDSVQTRTAEGITFGTHVVLRNSVARPRQP